MPSADNFEIVDAPMPRRQRRRRPPAHDLPVARSLHARAHERRARRMPRRVNSTTSCAATPSARWSSRATPASAPATSSPATTAGSSTPRRTARICASSIRTVAPISTAIGVLGMPGVTAYVGLLDIGQPKAGETVVVSAASGAVGSIVGQLAKIKGCRAVGIAGSPDKCRYVVDELGFDACINYKTDDLVPALRAACPQRHRHLLRERRRQGVRGGAARAQPRRAHPAVRDDLPSTTPRAIPAARTCGRCSSSAR